jgi:hypothetical protein
MEKAPAGSGAFLIFLIHYSGLGGTDTPNSGAKELIYLLQVMEFSTVQGA